MKRKRRKQRSVEDLVQAAKLYKTRGELYRKDKALYMSGYQRGLLPVMCAHMEPSRKKNKFVHSVPIYAKLIGEALNFDDLVSFRAVKDTTYDAGKRYGIDYVEVFERKDDPAFLRGLIKTMCQDKIQEIVNEEGPGPKT